jgi:demethylmenaquinone methyltransferase / 2-methoxy-6-polyprenyl-1,4-benzoquinol methylase
MTTPPRSDPSVVHAPHAVLDEYYASENTRRGFVGAIFDSTASDYDRVERVLGWGTGPWYRRQALQRAGLTAGMNMLDVAIGTGLVTREAQTILGGRGSIVGLDPSSGMMQAFAGAMPVPLVQGRAEALPFPDASFDFLSLGFALRHMADLELVFSEFRRVLKPGGRVLLLEITRPAGRLGTFFARTYFRTIVPGLAKVVARNAETPKLFRYYWDTIEACAPPEKVLATLRAAGFNNVDRHLEVGIFSEYRGAA